MSGGLVVPIAIGMCREASRWQIGNREASRGKLQVRNREASRGKLVLQGFAMIFLAAI